MMVSSAGISIPAPLSTTAVKLFCVVVTGIGAESSSSVAALVVVAGSKSTTVVLMLLLEAGADSTPNATCCSGIADFDFDHQKLQVCSMCQEEITLGVIFECYRKTE
jgi:hypothetical protein